MVKGQIEGAIVDKITAADIVDDALDGGTLTRYQASLLNESKFSGTYSRYVDDPLLDSVNRKRRINRNLVQSSFVSVLLATGFLLLYIFAPIGENSVASYVFRIASGALYIAFILLFLLPIPLVSAGIGAHRLKLDRLLRLELDSVLRDCDSALRKNHAKKGGRELLSDSDLTMYSRSVLRSEDLKLAGDTMEIEEELDEELRFRHSLIVRARKVAAAEEKEDTLRAVTSARISREIDQQLSLP